jgi:hypothetical protein
MTKQTQSKPKSVVPAPIQDPICAKQTDRLRPVIPAFEPGPRATLLDYQKTKRTQTENGKHENVKQTQSLQMLNIEPMKLRNEPKLVTATMKIQNKANFPFLNRKSNFKNRKLQNEPKSCPTLDTTFDLTLIPGNVTVPT